ncbi:MAG: hypothetical protein NWE76_04895, partial [Candidatus Bathyarchaeota archaeon]|nr:hypothetical protein [Candidatus Bathyarchaeota archaeon]
LRPPEDLQEMTNEICRIGEKVLAAFGAPVKLCERNDFSAADEIAASSVGEVKKLWGLPPNRLDFDMVTAKASIIYSDGPAVLPDVPNSFRVLVENIRAEPVSATVAVQILDGWKLSPSEEQVTELQPREACELSFRVVASAADIHPSNRGTVKIVPHGRPGTVRLPLNFVGGFRWLISPVFHRHVSLDTAFPAEEHARSMEICEGWEAVSWPENALKIEPFFKGRQGIIYMRHFIYSPDHRKAILGVPNNSRMRIWLNGEMIHETKKVVPLRPNYSGDGSNYTKAVLRKGWNHIMVKLLRGAEPVKAHFTVAHADWHRGMEDIVQCRFPWE